MKKILAAALSLLVVTGMFAACGNNNDNNGNAETTTTAPETTVAETTGESGGDLGQDIEEGLSDAMNTVAEAVEGAVEWPMMMVVSDAQMLKDYFTLDVKNPNYKDVMVKQAGVSAAIGEIIVIEANEGKVDEVVKDLEARKTKLIEQDAFYPEHKEIAQDAIVGKKGNYAYLLVGENAAGAENALKESLPK